MFIQDNTFQELVNKCFNVLGIYIIECYGNQNKPLRSVTANELFVVICI